MTVTVVTGAASGMGRQCVERLRGTTDQLVTVDLDAPRIEGTRGIACDISDPEAVAALVTQVHALGSFRALAHAAGVSPTMTHPRRILEIDLVGTALLLDAFEPLVEPGSAAVCFSSSSAYQVGLRGIDAELQALVSDPGAPGFLEAAESLVIPQLGKLLLDGLAPRELRQIGERQLVLLGHPFFGGPRVRILQSAIWVGDPDAMIIVHLSALGSNWIIELGSVVGA